MADGEEEEKIAVVFPLVIVLCALKATQNLI